MVSCSSIKLLSPSPSSPTKNPSPGSRLTQSDPVSSPQLAWPCVLCLPLPPSAPLFPEHIASPLCSLCFSSAGLHLKKYINFRERVRETLICCSTYQCIYWLILVCALTQDRTCNLGESGRCSKQPSYLARASSILAYPASGPLHLLFCCLGHFL